MSLPSLGWIGTGVMGGQMAAHCLRAGYPMTVYNRTEEKTEALRDGGALVAKTPQDVGSKTSIVFMMLGYPSDVRDVVLNPQTGILSSMAADSILVDLTTSEPSLAVEIAARAKHYKVHSVDAPVTGGDVGARNGTLSVLIGAESESSLNRLTPIMNHFASKMSHMGGPGAGQHCKLGNQITICSGMVGLCEGLIYAYKSGLDLDKYLAAIESGAAGSFSMKSYGPRMLHRDFKPGFFVDHFIKDLGIALAEAQKMKISLPGLALCQQLYVSLQAQGHGKDGTQALILAFESMNGLILSKS